MSTSRGLGWRVGSGMCVDTADIRIFLLLDLFHWEALPRKLGAPILPSAVIVEIRQASTRRRGFWTSWARLRFSVGHARSLVFLQTALFALWHGTSDYPGMGFVRAHTILSYALPCTTHPQCTWQTTSRISTARLSSQYCSKGRSDDGESCSLMKTIGFPTCCLHCRFGACW